MPTPGQSGFWAWDTSYVMSFDSTAIDVGAVVDIVQELTSAQVLNYTAFAGQTVVVFILAGFSAGSPSVSYASGYPSVTIPGQPSAAGVWMVMVG